MTMLKKTLLNILSCGVQHPVFIISASIFALANLAVVINQDKTKPVKYKGQIYEIQKNNTLKVQRLDTFDTLKCNLVGINEFCNHDNLTSFIYPHLGQLVTIVQYPNLTHNKTKPLCEIYTESNKLLNKHYITLNPCALSIDNVPPSLLKTYN